MVCIYKELQSRGFIQLTQILGEAINMVVGNFLLEECSDNNNIITIAVFKLYQEGVVLAYPVVEVM